MPATRRWAALGIAMTLALGVAGGFYWRAQTTGLDRVMLRSAELPAGTPAVSFVKTGTDPAPFHDRDHAVAGHHSIIVYHQPTCPDCRRLDALLERFVTVRRDVAVRKIDLGERWSADSARRSFGRDRIWWTPFIVIYGPDGKQIAADDGSRRDGWTLLKAWIDAELERASAGRATPAMRH